MAKQASPRVRALALPDKLKLAAARLSTDLENGNLGTVHEGLRDLGTFGLPVLLEMTNTMTGHQKIDLMKTLVFWIGLVTTPRPAHLRVLETLADLHLDASAP